MNNYFDGFPKALISTQYKSNILFLSKALIVSCIWINERIYFIICLIIFIIFLECKNFKLRGFEVYLGISIFFIKIEW